MPKLNAVCLLLLLNSSNGFLVRKRNILISAGAFGVGDAFAQTRLEASTFEAGTFDQHRLRSAIALGGVWGGVCSPQVYQLAEWLLPGRSPKRVLMKVGVSCGVLSSCGNWVNMFMRRASSGEASLADAIQAVNADLPRVMLHDLCVWPFYDVLCFSVIPPPCRPAATACVNAGWACYVSFVAARARQR